jgi:hypothetical protein
MIRISAPSALALYLLLPLIAHGGDEIHGGKQAPFASVVATLKTESAKAGQDIQLAFTIKNVSTQDVKFQETYPGFDFALDVKNSAGAPVRMRTRWKEIYDDRIVLRWLQITLKPGEESTCNIDRVNTMFELDTADVYTITAKRDFDKPAGTVTSNTVSLRITK